jgi:hypothetical protein
LGRPSNGARWTNEQLLFHMLLGYLIMRALLTLVRLFSRLPAGVSRAYARLLNTATTPFNAVNYIGSSLGGIFLGRDRMAAMFDRVITVRTAGWTPRPMPTSPGSLEVYWQSVAPTPSLAPSFAARSQQTTRRVEDGDPLLCGAPSGVTLRKMWLIVSRW